MTNNKGKNHTMSNSLSKPKLSRFTTVGVILLGIIFIVWLLLFKFGYLQLGNTPKTHRLVECRSQLDAIGRSIIMYRNEFDNKMPPDLEILCETEGLDPRGLLCPSSEDEPGMCSYIYRGSDLLADSPDEMIVAYDKIENHNSEFRYVLFFNGDIKQLEEKDFQVHIGRDNEMRRELGLDEKPSEIKI